MCTKPVYIALSKSAEKLPLCGSHFWGNPDLPVGYEYPTYNDDDGNTFEYQFICQVNLSELGTSGIECGLLEHGLLSFFAKIDYYLGYIEGECPISGYISGTEDVKVLFFPEVCVPCENDEFEEKILVDDDDMPVNPKELQMCFSAVRPSEYCEDHALMAEPTYREWENWDSPYEDWKILLQVDSFSGDDFNLNFMDFGVLDFLISPEDLKNSRFDCVRAIVLSS